MKDKQTPKTFEEFFVMEKDFQHDGTISSYEWTWNAAIESRDAEINKLKEEIKKFKRIAREALGALDNPDTPVSLGQDIIQSILNGDKDE